MEKKNKKPKVAVIGLKGLPAFGGAATVGENIIEKLKDKYDFTVYSVSSHTELKTGEYYGYRQIVFKSFFKGGINTLIYYFKSALHCIFLSKYNLIHLHHTDGALILPLLRIRYKVIVTAHGKAYENGKWNFFIQKLLQLTELFYIRFSNKAISVSKPHMLYYNKMAKKDCVIYIPNGISITNNNMQRKDNYIVFSAARIIPAKGCLVFLKALKKLNYKGKIKIIGDLNHNMKHKKEILEKAKYLSVEFLGLIKNKKELYTIIKKSTLFVFPSGNEAMSMMLLEVASLKVPIIASNIESNTAIFSNNEILFFENKNVSDLAEKIEFAINNREKMVNMANLAFKRVKSEYTWEKIASQYAILYESLFNSFN